MATELDLCGPGPDILSATGPTAADSSNIFFNSPFGSEWLELPATFQNAGQSFDDILPPASSWLPKPGSGQPALHGRTLNQPQTPKRPGRRNNSVKSNSSATKEEKEKREKFLERNRMAASKCRQKKRQNTERLQSQFRVAADKKAKLEGEVSQLHGEVLYLKDELLRHSQCDDQAIKGYLQQMVTQATHQEGPILQTPELSDPTRPLSLSPDSSVATQQHIGLDFDESLQYSDSAPQELDSSRRDSEQSLLSTTCTLFSDPSIDDMVDFT